MLNRQAGVGTCTCTPSKDHHVGRLYKDIPYMQPNPQRLHIYMDSAFFKGSAFFHKLYIHTHDTVASTAQTTYIHTYIHTYMYVV